MGGVPAHTILAMTLTLIFRKEEKLQSVLMRAQQPQFSDTQTFPPHFSALQLARKVHFLLRLVLVFMSRVQLRARARWKLTRFPPNFADVKLTRRAD